MLKSSIITALGLLITFCSLAQSNKTIAIDCATSWKRPVLGESLGYNGFFMEDLDNDGQIETLMTGIGRGTNLNFWRANLLNVVRLTDTDPNYEFIYQSEVLQDAYSIVSVNIDDLDGDDILEIFVGHNNGLFQVFQFVDQQLQEIHRDQVEDEITHIDFGDASNDGEKDIIIGTSDSMYFFRPSDYSKFLTLPLQSRDVFLVGDVDEDPNIEITTHFGVFEITDGQYINQWPSPPFNWPRFVLGDFNDDDNQEIAFQVGRRIQIFNVEDQATLFDFTTEAISKFIFTDLTQDGFPDIVYDGLIAYDFKNEEEIFETTNIDQRLAYLGMLDVNNDGIPEIVSSGDRVSAYNAETGAMLWNTESREDGGRVFELGNVDDDPQDEILLLTQITENITEGQQWLSSSYKLSVYDGLSKELEWSLAMPKDETPLGEVQITYDLHVANIDDDPAAEIIFGSTKLNRPYIVILDSESLEVEGSFTVEAASSVHRIKVGDVDNDGEVEIIAALEAIASGAPVKIYVFNSTDYSIEWESDDYHAGSLRDEFANLHIADIDDDGVQEIVAENYRVYIFDLVNDEFWISQETKVNGLTIANNDEDPQLEIIYYASDQGNFLLEMDGKTYEKRVILDTQNNYLDIKGLVSGDLNNNGIPEYYYGRSGYIYFFETPSKILRTPFLGFQQNLEDDFFLTNYQQDGAQGVILTSVGHAVLELDMKCYNCLDFSLAIEGTDPTCLGSGIDGRISSSLSGGEAPFDYMWSNGNTNSALDDLAEGNYGLTVSDASGCRDFTSTDLVMPTLSFTPSVLNNACVQGVKGAAAVIVDIGSPPYEYQWSNLESSDTITSLEPGIYSITVTDSNQCESIDSIEISASDVRVEAEARRAACNDLANGQALIIMREGQWPLEITWSTGAEGTFADNLPAGQSYFSVKDALGCTTEDSVAISAATFSFTRTIENSCKDKPTGKVTYRAIEGAPPYSVNFSNEFTDSIVFNEISANTFWLTIRDQNCSLIDTLVIDTFALYTQLEPLQTSSNPVLFQLDANTTGDNPPFSYQWDDPEQQTDSVATNLVQDLYNVLITDQKGCELYSSFDLSTIVSSSAPSPKNIQIYPNPFQEHIQIDLEGDYILKVFDLQSRLIKEIQVKSGHPKQYFDFSALSAGVYLLSLKDAQHTYSSMIVKQ